MSLVPLPLIIENNKRNANTLTTTEIAHCQSSMYSLQYLMPKDDAPRKYPVPILPDDFDEEENEIIAPLPSRLSSQTSQGSNVSKSSAEEDASLALALRLQEEEERRMEHLRLHDDFHYAQSLQQRFEQEDKDNNNYDDDDEVKVALDHSGNACSEYSLSTSRMQKLKRTVKKQNHSRMQDPLVTATTTLAECQIRALYFVQEKARHMHQATLPELQKRVHALGYSETALEQCLEYIRQDAPIIIHLKEPTLALLAQDSHYRNLFETGTSGGKNSTSARQRWEAALFGNSYDKRCHGSLRPKYACLNITGDVQGCFPARHYGDLYITLCKHVRHRVTMSDDDTGRNHQDALATCDAYAHVLARYNDTDLKAVLNVASTRVRRIRGAPSRSTTYKECQIHGPVNLRTDVEALSIPESYAEASEELHRTVQAFQQLTGCNVIWQMDLFV